jgi:hypothetical protein
MGAATVLKNDETTASAAHKACTAFTIVMKFGGFLLASAERMREVVDLILSFSLLPPLLPLQGRQVLLYLRAIASRSATSYGRE